MCYVSLAAKMKWSHILNIQNFRWGTAAEDVCFSRPFHAFSMALGRMLPLTRGGGVYQKPMDFCISQLTAGKWIHIFPESTYLDMNAPRFIYFLLTLVSLS